MKYDRTLCFQQFWWEDDVDSHFQQKFLSMKGEPLLTFGETYIEDIIQPNKFTFYLKFKHMELPLSH